MTLIPFILVGFITIAFATNLVVCKNAVHGALSLVAVLAALAVFFLLLSAEFIFVVQIAVYAGAIMVLFLFVMMLLNVGGSEGLLNENTRWQLWSAVVLAIGLVALIGTRLYSASREILAQLPPAAPEGFGSPQEIGQVLFSDYLLPFELTSLILLAAMVGAVVLAKRRLV
ncbi:MAG: NADH-quinone oxidoreductase subunit J [Armatimonadota bacterium]